MLVDDSQLLVDFVSEVLRDDGWEVRAALRGEDAIAMTRDSAPEVVICDLHMPEMNGLEVMRQIHAIDSQIPVVMLSGNQDLALVLAAVHQGAFDYVTKSGKDTRPLVAAVERAATHVRLTRENTRLSNEVRLANQELEENLKQLDRQHQLLQEEQRRSETLLHNVLPRPIADRLRLGEERIADGFTVATVLFADIVDFSGFAKRRSPRELVHFLNELFSECDRLAIEVGVEKIKTIGDAYMAASGLPVPRKDHAETMARFALALGERISRKSTELGEQVSLRIGMHSGPLVAGIVGESKFCYDLWGDTVNIASRMESHGQAGAIHVSSACAELLPSCYQLESRGQTPLKGYGTMHTYFLK